MSNTEKSFPRPLIFCGPSGSGKTTLLKKIIENFPDKLKFCVSYTTRKPRPDEIDGVHYNFISAEEMEKLIRKGEFLERTCFNGNWYGTSKTAVHSIINLGKVCVLDVNIEGAKQIKLTDLNAWFVFIKPPSFNVLEKRLAERNTESVQSLKERLKIAAEEIAFAEITNNFDIIIINDKLDSAYDQLRKFLIENVLNF